MEERWGGTPGPWRLELDMRQDYDHHAHEYRPGPEDLAGYNIIGLNSEVVGCEGIIPGEFAEIDARAIAEVPVMVQTLRDAVALLHATDSDGRDTLAEIKAILARIFVDPKV